MRKTVVHGITLRRCGGRDHGFGALGRSCDLLSDEPWPSFDSCQFEAPMFKWGKWIKEEGLICS